MNKAEVIELVQKNLGEGTTKAAATRALEAVTGAITTAVTKSGNAQLIGFGTFSLSKRGARKGRNPKTGEALTIKASVSVKFKPSKSIKDSLAPKASKKK